MTEDKFQPSGPFGREIEVRGVGVVSTEDSVENGKRVRVYDHRTGRLFWVERDRDGEWGPMRRQP